MAAADLSGLRMRDYSTLLSKAQKTSSKVDLLAVLKHMRRNKIDDPRNCTALSSKIVKDMKSSVSTEDLLAICEQHVEASLEIGDTDGAMLGFDIISAQFPPKTSQRSKRLLGMILEANGELDDAEKLYKGMLELNKANALAYKRLVCVAMARGDADGAVKQLNDYVKNFTGDHSAWLQLAELHEQAGRFAYAAFCYEEVVLLKPAEPYPQAKLAECILRQVADPQSDMHRSAEEAQGAAQQARRHAAHAVKQSSSTYPRALWCLAAACRAVAFVRAGRTEGCVDARLLDALDFAAPPGSDAALASSWGGYVAPSTAAATVTLSDDLLASDDNYALFGAAVAGLRGLYGDSSAAAHTYTQLQSLQVAYNPCNWDGEVAGSWGDAAAALQRMADDIASVAA